MRIKIKTLSLIIIIDIIINSFSETFFHFAYKIN